MLIKRDAAIRFHPSPRAVANFLSPPSEDHSQYIFLTPEASGSSLDGDDGGSSRLKEETKKRLIGKFGYSNGQANVSKRMSLEVEDGRTEKRHIKDLTYCKSTPKH